MSGCRSGSSPRRAATRWHCWSFRGGGHQRSRLARLALRPRRGCCGGRGATSRRRLGGSVGGTWARGGMRSAAACLHGGAWRARGPARRAGRALAAAEAASQAGAFDAALGLLAAAEAGPLDELQRAQAALLHGQIAFASFRGRDAETLLVKAARLFEPLDARLARETYLDALSAALFAAGLREAGGTTRAAPPPPRPARARALLRPAVPLRAPHGSPSGAPAPAH